MWNCPSCGEASEENFSRCWNCGAAPDGTRDASATETGELPDGSARATLREKLDEIQGTLGRQQGTLDQMGKRVGCLYYFLLLQILLLLVTLGTTCVRDAS